MPVAGKFAVVAMVASIAGSLPLYAQVTANSKAASLDRCVEPTEYMRKNHMEVLLHQRDLTVHQGIRTERHSLVGCIDCHAGKDEQGRFVSVDAKGQFCGGCHEVTAVDIDCFQCHASTPEVDNTAGSSLPVQVAMATNCMSPP